MTWMTPQPTATGDRRRLGGPLLACLLMLGGTAALVGCADMRGSPPVGYEVQGVSLQPLSNAAGPVSTDDLKGKVTLMNFWATWCGPCVAEFPHLLRIADGYRGRSDFQFVSVSTGHADIGTLQSETEQFMKGKGYTIPVYADGTGATQKAFRGLPNAIPVTVLIDREGKVASVAVGFDSAKLDEMNLQIASMLKKPTP